MSHGRAWLALVVLGLVVAPGAVAAHPLDVGYLRIESQGATVDVALDVDSSAVAVVLGVDASTITASTLQAGAAAFAAATYAREPITTEAGPCTWSVATATLTDRTARVASTARCPAGGGVRRWQFPFIRDSRISGTFELLVKETVGGGEKLTLVDRYAPPLELGAAAGAGTVGFADFVWSGVEHIGAAPKEWRGDDGLKLPDGIDHILFLLGLLLGGGTLLGLVGIASGFTVGHSITLALAALGVVHPPSWLIEPLIALSIALVAVEAFTGLWKQHRWKIAMGFGLIHGFGFANALTELELSTRQMVTALFGYNLGVELGQVAIVLLIAPLVLWAHRHDRVKAVAVRGVAALIFVAGMYWFVERVVTQLAR